MKTLLTAILGAAVLVLPATALAKQDEADKRSAIAHCKAERGKTKATRNAFKAKHHSFRGCVTEVRAARQNAAQECKAERSDDDFASTHEDKTFEEFYGTNANHKNAFGKCVSGKVREQEDADEADEAEEAGEDEHGRRGDQADEHHGHGNSDSDDQNDEPED
jgi:hypothetical protein